MRTFLLKLRIQGCREVLIPGLGPGIVAIQEIGFHSDDVTKIAVSLVHQKDSLIRNIIEVEIEEITATLASAR